MKSKSRIRSTGEIFTPPALVDEIIDKLYTSDPTLFTDPNKTFCDPAEGNGRFLEGVIRKLIQVQPNFNFQHTFDNQIYGVDLMFDNVCDSIYYLFTTMYPTDDENKANRISNAIQKTGFDIEDHANLTPDEINSHFTQIREYVLGDDVTSLQIRRKDNHHVEYRCNTTEKWVTCHHIVRANSLIEWDFENWHVKDLRDDNHKKVKHKK